MKKNVMSHRNISPKDNAMDITCNLQTLRESYAGERVSNHSQLFTNDVVQFTNEGAG